MYMNVASAECKYLTYIYFKLFASAYDLKAFQIKCIIISSSMELVHHPLSSSICLKSNYDSDITKKVSFNYMHPCLYLTQHLSFV